MSTMTAEPTETSELEPLSAKSRCDATRSGVEQAWARFQNDAGHILDLCFHHSNVLEASLIGAGFRVLEDVRADINTKPSPSATVMGDAPEAEFEEDDDSE